MFVRLTALIAFVAIPWLTIGSGASAQGPGPVANATVELRAAPDTPIGFEVVVRWTGHGDPNIRYEIWRRTPWDLRFQEAEKYADVQASAVLADGTFEFVDPDPFGMTDRPCYMIGATTGDTPPNSFALPGCIPTQPSMMAGLSLTALPGPDPNSWYVTGRGFAPGAFVTLQELTCHIAPCDSDPLPVSTRIQAGIDGRFSVYTTLPPGDTPDTRKIVAYEEGWLDSLFSLAPTVSVPASQPGAVFGYPLSARTGVAGVDRVLTALDAQDPGGLQSLFILQKLPASDGELVDALPTLTCGNGDSIAIAPQVLPATAADLLGERIYAVFTIAPAADPWLAFSRATHAIVLSGAGGGGYPRSSMIAVNAQGIVGAGRPCGTPPTFYLRDVGTYLLPPLTTAAPASPSAGAGMVRDNTAGPDMLVIAATALAMLGGAGVWFLARRRGP
ncbi:MAG: hypothetical protein KC495_03225 [Dehalococcoidia bacterium]|nr:hypothetical protein [Dehalococcoidia bacterium]